MEPGEFIPAGEPALQTADKPRIRDTLILPVLFSAAAWAVNRFTRSTLGDWRYVPVVVLGLCAIYFTVLALVLALVFNVDKFDAWSAPSRLGRITNVLFKVLIVGVVILVVVRAVRDHSVIDAVTALVFVIWAAFIPGSTNFATMSRSRKPIYRVAVLLLPAWFLVVTFAHLR